MKLKTAREYIESLRGLKLDLYLFVVGYLLAGRR